MSSSRCRLFSSLATLALVLATLWTSSTWAHAQSVENFYRGRNVRLVVAAAAGGGADLHARVLVRHLGKHIPGHPTFFIQNVPGAAGLLAAGQLQASVPADGSAIALLQRNNLLEPLLAQRDTGFDPRKVSWIGSLNKDTYVIISWHTSGIRSLEEAMQKELILGNTGGGNENVTFPLLLNQTIGTKFKLVRGYKGNADLAIALERGEVQGRAVTWTTLRGDRADWIAEKKINLLVQLGLKRHPELPDVPSAMEFAKEPDTRSLFELMFATLDAGRPFAVPLKTPQDRLAALRAAFKSLSDDKEFVAELTSHGGSVEFLGGEDIDRLAASIYRSPPQVIERARKLVNER
jgi:tripartite-type tricarboxylate transporter receptor subunit TctC